MFPHEKTDWLVEILLVLAVVTLMGSCHLLRRDDSPTGPVRGQRHGLSLKFAEDADLSKMTGGTIEAVALDHAGNPTDVKVDPVSIAPVTSPQAISLTVYVPPCRRWRITVTVSLSRGTSRSTSTVMNACQTSDVRMVIETFEEFEIGANPLLGPDTALRGETLQIFCGPA